MRTQHIGRRTFLRGAGACLALPVLDCMASGKKTTPPPARLGVVYFPFGVSLPLQEDKQDWQQPNVKIPHKRKKRRLRKINARRTLSIYEKSWNKVHGGKGASMPLYQRLPKWPLALKHNLSFKDEPTYLNLAKLRLVAQVSAST